MHSSEIDFRETVLGSHTIRSEIVAGYDVEALDRSVGSVDEATFDAGSAYVVVDTGPWIFGKKVVIPAGLVRGVDHDDERVYVDRTKEQLKDAPEYDEVALTDDGQHQTA